MRKIDYDRAVVNHGNTEKIQSVLRRAEAGADLTIAFLGGSITQGSLASTPQLCYAYRVYEWWQQTFPKAHFKYLNAGIGATDSQFGCARVQEDVLEHFPDFVLLEYAVNDAANAHYRETFEGVVRRILQADSSPALMIMYNVCYDSGSSAELFHAQVVRHYDLPAVSMRSTIYPELLAGRIRNEEITPDNLHPNDAGHELVASVITCGLEQIRAEMDRGAAGFCPPLLPAPLTENAYEDSVRFRNMNACVVACEGFTADPQKQEHITEIFRCGWTAKEKGSRIVFRVEGSCIGVQYRKTIQLPAPVAEVILDGDTEHAQILDANFDETWGDKLVLDTILDHGKPGEHFVEIRLKETHPDDRLPFYLVSVIASGRD